MINYINARKSQDNPEAMLVSQGKGNLYVEIEKLEEPIKRLDGKRVSFMFNIRYLSVECQHANDEAWACVTGAAYVYWSEKELKEIGIQPSRNSVIPEDYDIFEHVIIQ